jgi:uncharacterized protein (DUF433 family)
LRREACIVRTRIPVWLLEQTPRLGASEYDLLVSYHSLRAGDLASAWAYVRSHLSENRGTDSGQRDGVVSLARFYSNENMALRVVAELRRLGHDVLTTLDAGKANDSVPDSKVLAFATAERRIFLPHNRRHFLQLDRHWSGGPRGYGSLYR